MYLIEPPLEREVKVYLCSRGTLRPTVFSSVEDFCNSRSLGFVERWVGRRYGDQIKIVTRKRSWPIYNKETRKITWKFPEEYYFEETDFILRTDMGETLTSEELRPVYYEIYRQRRKWSQGRRSQGLKSGSCYGKWKAPKTRNEMRQAFQNKDEGEPPIRPRRNLTNLPSLWDDKYADVQKSWKFQSKRKKQYKKYATM